MNECLTTPQHEGKKERQKNIWLEGIKRQNMNCMQKRIMKTWH